jgi:predicted phage tail protein
MDVASPREAIAALDSQLKGFRKWMSESHNFGVAYAVFAGKNNLTEDELLFDIGGDDIRIAPVYMGKKNGGIINIILGIVLIVVGLYIGVGSGGLAGIVAQDLVIAGIGLIAGGIVQLLAPHPKSLSTKENADSTPSYAFSGIVNTEAQGHPVPLLYGRLKVGSAVASAGIDVQDSSLAVAPPVTGGSTGGMGGGGDMMNGRVEGPA